MEKSAKFVIPEYVSDESLLSTNVPENDLPLYDLNETYKLNDEVMYIKENVHWIVRSLVDGNQGNTPTGLKTDVNWVKLRENNRWRMFDQKTTSQTIHLGSIDVSVAALSMMDTVYIGNADVGVIDIQVKDQNDSVVYSRTENMIDNSNVNSYYDYFFAPILKKRDVVFDDIPPHARATVNLTADNGSSDAKIGTLIIGKQVELGYTRYGATLSNRSYSVKTADEFGDFSITKRPYSRTMEITAELDKLSTDYTKNILDQYESVVVLYIGTKEYSTSYIVGIYEDYEINLDFPNHNLLEFKILGLS